MTMKQDHELYLEFNAADQAGKAKEWFDSATLEERDRVFNYMAAGTAQGMADICRLMGIAVQLEMHKSGDESVSLAALQEDLDAINERWPWRGDLT
jgi:hypothetical protein